MRSRRERVPGLASVVIPSYNKAGYLRDTLDSVASQTYRDIELIVVDDASTDGSVEIIQQWAEQAPVPTL